jgi:diacylglycerol kinase (ATP)
MLIYNPAAGHRGMARELQDAMRYLEGRGWQIVWRQTRGTGDATTYAREAAATGLDVAIAAGGDGTIGQVVNGIAGTQTALGVIPVGTANVWAREVGLPYGTPLHQDSVQDAVEILAEGQPRVVDLGRVNGTYFLMWVGIGFDAQVTAEVETRPEVKRRFGLLFFTITALTKALNLKGTRAGIVLDGERLSQRVLLIVASNIQLYGGIMRIAPMASMNDGLLDICIFRGYSGLRAYIHFVSILLGTHTRNPEITYHQGRRMTIETSRPLPVHLDGDVIGTTPVEIEVVPHALHVIVPRRLSSPALKEEGADSTPSDIPLAKVLADFWRRIRQ